MVRLKIQRGSMPKQLTVTLMKKIFFIDSSRTCSFMRSRSHTNTNTHGQMDAAEPHLRLSCGLVSGFHNEFCKESW